MQRVCWLLCLIGLAGALAAPQKDQVAQRVVRVYQTKENAQKERKSWVANNCKQLVGLLRKKNVVVKKLSAAANTVARDQSLSEPEKHFQVANWEILSC